MKECPKCKHVLEDHCDFCPYCGQSLASVPKTSEMKSSGGINPGGIISASKKEEKEIPLTESEAKKGERVRIVDICLGWLLIILPFVFHGFSFDFFWYLLIAVVAFLTLISHASDIKTTIDKGGAVGYLVIMIIIGIIMFIWGPLNPNYK